jgi:beta-aspartyl-peptidase (threonine type)
MPRLTLTLLTLLTLLSACAAVQRSEPTSAAPRWAIAIHGGAGVMAGLSPEAQRERLDSLRRALSAGRDILSSGGSSLDAAERVVRILEDEPLFNAGKGAVFTEAGTHELDAAIMDGSTLKAGAVAGVKTVKNPISLARLVMQQTRHVLLTGEGAEAFATEAGVERVPNDYFSTPGARRELERVLDDRRREQAAGASADPASEPPSTRMSTVGCVALDTAGRLAAATSTGGLTAKRWGRVGDVPIIGAGTYANALAAVSCTGVGEQFIRHTVAREVVALMTYRSLSPRAAADELIFNRLNPDDGGLIVVSATGEIALVFSTPGMARGAADSSGRFEVGLYREMER